MSKTWCRIGVLAAFIFLCSCDLDLLGVDLKEIAGGYRLKRGDGQFSLLAPRATGGPIIDELGWREPIIIARASGSDYWDVVNTARAQRTRLSDEQRKSDPQYQSIPIESAEKVWDRLDRHKQLW